jgi:TRAP transporter T-component
MHRQLPLIHVAVWLLPALLLGGCSMGQLVVRGSQPLLDSGIRSMNRETDLQLARDAMPANLKLMEGMLIEDPHNHALRLHAAEGFYAYSYGFIEPEDRARAGALYQRCYDHARLALQQDGLQADPATASADALHDAVARLGQPAVPALFWTASCLGKWIDLNRDQVAGIAGLGNAAALMERVLELDDTYYHGGANLFFGAYYGGRSPLLGGDFKRAEQYFRRAAEINGGKLLLVDVLEAQYLYRQQLNRTAFHRTLSDVLSAPVDSVPDLTLINSIARRNAGELLQHEEEWF